MGRGGDWADTAQDCRMADRFYCLPGSFFPRVGLRCVRSNLNAPVPVIGPIIKANGATGTVTIDYPATASITVEMNASNYAGTDVDWWVIACANGAWYYLNGATPWADFNGNFTFCQPVYQGALCNLSATSVLNAALPLGTYDFWFAVDYPMDGVLNPNGQILYNQLTIVVQ